MTILRVWVFRCSIQVLSLLTSPPEPNVLGGSWRGVLHICLGVRSEFPAVPMGSGTCMFRWTFQLRWFLLGVFGLGYPSTAQQRFQEHWLLGLNVCNPKLCDDRLKAYGLNFEAAKLQGSHTQRLYWEVARE